MKYLTLIARLSVSVALTVVICFFSMGKTAYAFFGVWRSGIPNSSMQVLYMVPQANVNTANATLVNGSTTYYGPFGTVTYSINQQHQSSSNLQQQQQQPGRGSATCTSRECPSQNSSASNSSSQQPGKKFITYPDQDEDGIPDDGTDPCIDSDGDGQGDPAFELQICEEDLCPYDSSNTCAAAKQNGHVTGTSRVYPDEDRDGKRDDGVADTCVDTDGDGLGNAEFLLNTCKPDRCPADPGNTCKVPYERNY